MRWPAMMRLTCIGILAQFALLLLAFGVLTYCFLISDFSVIYVAQHSYSLLSWELKLAAVWGGHEGSLLLWVLLLSAWSALFAWHYRQQTDPLFPLTLAVLSLMLAALLLFVVLWSDPFMRIFPPAIEGRDLNPMLQHPGLIFHPPLLFLGYGGFTVPEVDKILAPYAEKSYNKLIDKYKALGLSDEVCAAEATADIQEEFAQGFQGWEYKFNTVASSRGDYPFITMTMGLGKSRFEKMASKTMLAVRRKGQGKKSCKKPVLFPKIVFLYDETLHGPGMELEDVFEAGIECSRKTMYPDWLSLTGEGYVAGMYKKYGRVVSPMGCRAFLSPWYERGGMTPADENDKPVFVGRFNIGAVSLHLPMIYAKAQKESRDFYEVLDYYLELIRNLHLRTYDYLGEMRASTNPLAYCEGGFYGGHLGIHDKIQPLLKTATASFGITALNELQQLHNKKSIAEDGQFAVEVMEYINKKVGEFKEADGRLYALYGTPAESLCGLQVKQFRAKYGIIENVSDREYVSNSFHCHVTEDISPIQKQDLEKRFWDLMNGGKIQYVKYPIDYNVDAVKTLVRRAMDMGFYEGVNLSLAYCDDCGHQELEMDVCPKCGSRNLTKIERMNGYLSYSRVKGDTRLNDAKMAEIKDRRSM